jgi:hypothetical protein
MKEEEELANGDGKVKFELEANLKRVKMPNQKMANLAISLWDISTRYPI